MTKWVISYSDESMIEAHLEPYTWEVEFDHDAELDRFLLDKVAELHGYPRGLLSLVDVLGQDSPDVFYMPRFNGETLEKIGEATFDWVCD